MKKIALMILPVILFSCTNDAYKITPKAYQQITYLIDTLAENHVLKELRNITEVKLNDDGELESAVQTNFSYENQEGISENVEEVYSPDLFWLSSYQSDLSPIYKKYAEQELTDTLIIDGKYTFQYNEKSQLISFTDDGYWNQIHFIYDQHGQWIQATVHILEERSGHITYKITKRKIQYNDDPIKSIKQPYLTINGVDILKKENRSIADYYVLLKKTEVFIPGNDGGTFDVANGFFEYEDEGTGGGNYTGQLALFKTNDGKDIIAINGFYGDALAYYQTGGSHPKFYLFENNLFSEIPNIFPEVNIQMFFDSDYNGSVEEISSYFSLPKKGLSIQYKIDEGLENFCEKLDNTNDNYDHNKEICDRYSNVKRTSIDITFDKLTGTFKIKN
ncbi:MAG: hypothetical protein KAS71_08395 [Bacteroidales bacterium]|nr:hypothetical protein [Bacteroidales bacterium]